MCSCFQNWEFIVGLFYVTLFLFKPVFVPQAPRRRPHHRSTPQIRRQPPRTRAVTAYSAPQLRVSCPSPKYHQHLPQRLYTSSMSQATAWFTTQSYELASLFSCPENSPSPAHDLNQFVLADFDRAGNSVQDPAFQEHQLFPVSQSSKN